MTINRYNGSASAWEQATLQQGLAFRYDSIAGEWFDVYLPDGLVAYYPFEPVHTTTSIVDDASGNGQDGTLNGPSTNTFSPLGDCASLDGVDDNITLGEFTLPATGASIAAWVRPTAVDSVMDIAFLGDNPPHLEMQLNNGEVTFFNDNGSASRGVTAYLAPTGGPDAGTWSHVAGTFNGSTWRTYLDGTELTSNTDDRINFSFTGALNRIGSHPEFNRWFDGRLDEVRIYNRALSAAEVTALSEQGRPV